MELGQFKAAYEAGFTHPAYFFQVDSELRASVDEAVKIGLRIVEARRSDLDLGYRKLVEELVAEGKRVAWGLPMRFERLSDEIKDLVSLLEDDAAYFEQVEHYAQVEAEYAALERFGAEEWG